MGQWPIGYFSDRYDRRSIIVITTFSAALLAFFSILTSNDPIENIYWLSEMHIKKILFFLFVGMYTSFCLPLFSLNLAHTNDFVSRDQFVAAGGGLQLIFGFGAISGPILCSVFMQLFGLNGFFIFLIVFHIFIGIFGIHRMKIRDAITNPDSSFTPIPATITPAGLELDPDTPVNLENNNGN